MNKIINARSLTYIGLASIAIGLAGCWGDSGGGNNQSPIQDCGTACYDTGITGSTPKEDGTKCTSNGGVTDCKTYWDNWRKQKQRLTSAE